MQEYKMKAVTTKYWRPGENYLKEIEKGIHGKIEDGDLLIISEKAISTASNNITDESKIKASLNAKLIAAVWMRIVWGYFLGVLCHFNARLLQRLREYPFEEGSRHKQAALVHASLFRALMFGSEGGIDGSNLAYSYVSLPLEKADHVAEEIRKYVHQRLRKRICVMIADTDKTYSFRSFHLTPRPTSVRGVHSFGGFTTYVIGRALALNRRATPVAIAGCKFSVEEVLQIAEAANRLRGFGAGRTVWDMAAKFHTSLGGVSWEMLDTVRHKPIVIIKRKR
jgi:F420-0:gamma-glutamyl ligase-like protein